MVGLVGGVGQDPGLLVGRGDPVHQGIDRPGVLRRAVGARPPPDVELPDRSRALPQHRAQAVGAGVAAADDHHLPPLGAERRPGPVALLHPVGQRQELHRLVDAGQLAPGHRQLAGHSGADGDHHRVIAGPQVGGVQVGADRDAGAEDRPLRPHLLDPAVHLVLLQLERRDAVPEQPAEAVVPLVHRDGVPGPGELLRAGQPGRSGADHRHRPVRLPFRRQRAHPALVPGVLGDGRFHVLDGHRVGVDGQHAAALAGRGAGQAGELGEVVGRVQPLAGRRPVLPLDQLVPLRDEIAQRAGVVAEGDAAVHAASGLRAHDRQQRPRLVHVPPVPDPLRDGAQRPVSGGGPQEAPWVGHRDLRTHLDGSGSLHGTAARPVPARQRRAAAARPTGGTGGPIRNRCGVGRRVRRAPAGPSDAPERAGPVSAE